MPRRRRNAIPAVYAAMSVEELRESFLRQTTEDAVQIEIVSLLRTLPPPPIGPYWNAVNPIPMKAGKATAAKAKRMGLRAGAPDIDLLWSGRFAAVECKRPIDGYVRPSQTEIHEEIIAAGGFVAVVRSVGEFISFVKETFPVELEAVRSRFPIVLPWWDIVHAS